MSDSGFRRSAKSTPKRRFQFGIKTLLSLPIYVAAFCAIGVWLGWPLAVLFLAIPTVIFSRRFGNTGVETATLLVVVALVAGLLMPAVQSGPHYHRRCINNLRLLGQAILQYEAETGSLPPPWTLDEDGRPLASWRTLILPYLEYNDLYSRYCFEEHWDSPINSELGRIDLSCFRCPGDAAAQRATTSYVAVVGPGTAWSAEGPIRLSDIDNPSRTILLVETVGSSIRWSEPRDLSLDEALRGIAAKAGGGISSDHSGDVFVLFVDGHVEFLRKGTKIEEFRDMLTFEKRSAAEAGMDHGNED